MPVDVADIDIEHLDVDLVSRTQIVEFISRNEVDLARIVEVILIAQGYRVQVSPFGKYGGVGMVAEGGEGPIGFRLPRIAVLVHPGSEVADPDINELEAFLALSGAAQGLFVSWVGFSDAARAEAGRLFHEAKFWDIGQTVAEWITHHSGGGGLSFGTGFFSGGGGSGMGMGVGQSIGSGSSDKTLKLTFGTNNVLTAWSKN